MQCQRQSTQSKPSIVHGIGGRDAREWDGRQNGASGVFRDTTTSAVAAKQRGGYCLRSLAKEASPLQPPTTWQTWSSQTASCRSMSSARASAETVPNALPLTTPLTFCIVSSAAIKPLGGEFMRPSAERIEEDWMGCVSMAKMRSEQTCSRDAAGQSTPSACLLHLQQLSR